ncbi:Subunit of the glycosylphosphatidylinositol transamidase complex-like protein [Rhizina undulata]
MRLRRIIRTSSLSAFLAALCLLIPATTADPTPHNDYDENLLLKTLPGNSVLASFRFVSNGTFDNHHSIFPRSLSQVLQQSGTKELHLKFTLGRWDAELWGEHIWNGKTAGGTGVELWAWVEAEGDDAADKRWTTLTNSLSGLFCASLNFIDSTRTIRPVLSFQPAGHHASTEKLHLLHGSLPREPVCTENLTPFLKLLPCKGKAGISSLLDGHKLFDAAWQSMSIDVRPVCEEDGECKLQMEQTVDMVLDVERSLRRRDSPIPKPPPISSLSCDPSKSYSDRDACYPLDSISTLPWSLSEIFGRPLHGVCPLSTTPGIPPTPVCVNVPDSSPIFTSIGSQEIRTSLNTRCFVVQEGIDFDIILPEQTSTVDLPFTPPPLYAFRSFTGHGQERGGVKTVLVNPSLEREVEFVYLESLPWFMKPYLHTFSAELVDGKNDDEQGNVVREIYYRPALDRRRGTQLEVKMVVPRNSTVLVTYDFEKAVLRYTEYPPDANRGFDIAPAIITVLDPETHLPTKSIRTTSLLLSLPTPDFSMPYNVIILTSTVMALAFGSIFNILVRRFVAADEAAEAGMAAKVRGIVKGLLARIKKRLREMKTKPKTE